MSYFSDMNLMLRGILIVKNSLTREFDVLWFIFKPFIAL